MGTTTGARSRPRPSHPLLAAWAMRLAGAAILTASAGLAGCATGESPPGKRAPAGPRGPATAVPLTAVTAPPIAAPPENDALGAPGLGAPVIPILPTRPLGIPTSTTPTEAPQVLFDAAERGAAAATGSCAVPQAVELWSLAPGAEAPAAAREAWDSAPAATLDVEVVGIEAEGRRFRLRSIEPPADYDYELASSGAPLPLVDGGRYRLTYAHDVAGGPPTGSGLVLSDDAGTVFVGASVRETDGAAGRLLGGQRGGFAVRQFATRCEAAVTSACGYALRAADLEVARGANLTVAAAGSPPSILAGAPRYRVTVYASHVRQWLGDAPCADPTDWVQSYRIERQ